VLLERISEYRQNSGSSDRRWAHWLESLRPDAVRGQAVPVQTVVNIGTVTSLLNITL